jgi:tRNA A37 threonylcarbamoyltransferase TsaD
VVERCRRAVRGARLLAAGGGVTLNRRLRERLGDMAREEGVELYLAEAPYCGDNAAMIAGLAERGGGRRGAEAMEADAEPNLTVELT